MQSRKEDRLIQSETVLIELLSDDVDNQGNLVLSAETSDISASGMKVFSSSALNPNYIHELLVIFDEHSKKYLLTGEVKWCEKVTQSLKDNGVEGYYCGFELLEAEHSDLRDWKTLFED